MWNPNLFRYAQKRTPAWFPALSAADQCCGPLRFRGYREEQAVLFIFQDSVATAFWIRYLRVKEDLCPMTCKF
jgi:hypothetical protein